MSIPQSIKTKVKNDWLQAFPELAAYTQVRFYKIAGPIIFGIEIVKSNFGDKYRLYFDVHPLWEENLIQCINHSSLYFPIHNKKNLQIIIEYSRHDALYEDAANSVRKYIQMPFEEDIPLKSIYEVIEKNTLSQDAYGNIQAYLIKLHLLLYLGCNKEMDKLLKEVEKKRKMLNCKYIVDFYGSFDLWFETLKDSMSRRDEFLRKIEENKQDKKLKNMVVSKIIV